MAQAANKLQTDSGQDLADAFHVHAALVSVESRRPELKNNPRWQMIRMDAYEAFWTLMGGA